MRNYMVDPDNKDRLLKVPPHVVAAIKAEAVRECNVTVLAYADERLDAIKINGQWPDLGLHESVVAALRVAASRIKALGEQL